MEFKEIRLPTDDSKQNVEKRVSRLNLRRSNWEIDLDVHYVDWTCACIYYNEIPGRLTTDFTDITEKNIFTSDSTNPREIRVNIPSNRNQIKSYLESLLQTNKLFLSSRNEELFPRANDFFQRLEKMYKFLDYATLSISTHHVRLDIEVETAFDFIYTRERR